MKYPHHTLVLPRHWCRGSRCRQLGSGHRLILWLEQAWDTGLGMVSTTQGADLAGQARAPHAGHAAQLRVQGHYHGVDTRLHHLHHLDRQWFSRFLLCNPGVMGHLLMSLAMLV